MRSEAANRIFAEKKKKNKWLTWFFFLHCSSIVWTKSRGFHRFYIFKRQRAFPLLKYPHLNTNGSWESSRKLCKRQTQLRVCIALESIKKILANSCSCLLSVTNLSKIQNQARVDELPSPSMENVTLQWLPNLPPRLFLPP